LFPKNPQLCDYVLEKAVGEKLYELDDEAEVRANSYMVQRIGKAFCE